MREENHTMDELVLLPDRKSVIFHNDLLFHTHFYRPPTKLREDNVFNDVCHSVRGWWVCLVPDSFGGVQSGSGRYVQGVGMSGGGVDIPEGMGIPEGGVVMYT